MTGPSVRLTGGKHKGLKVSSFSGYSFVRPAQSVVRETLFNWLRHYFSGTLEGLHCLDLYAGSGVLSWEGLSRGASSVSLVEKNRNVCQLLQAQAAKFAPSIPVSIFCAEVVPWMEDTEKRRQRSKFALMNPKNTEEKKQYDIIFVDPPYKSSELQIVLPLLLERDLLSPRGLIFYETIQPLKDFLAHNELFDDYKISHKGQTHFGLLVKKTRREA